MIPAYRSRRLGVGLPLAYVNPPKEGGQAADLVPGSRQLPEVLRVGDAALDETPQDGDFATGRRALLQGLVKKKGARARC